MFRHSFKLLFAATLISSCLYSSQSHAALDLDSEFDFLNQLQNTVDSTDESVIESHISRVVGLEAIAKSASEMTDLDLLESGYYGLLAEKKHSAKFGKVAFDKLQAALLLSPTDSRVVMAYSESVASMNSKSRIAKAFIESSLGIHLGVCRQNALDHLRNLKVQAGSPEADRVQKEIQELSAQS